MFKLYILAIFLLLTILSCNTTEPTTSYSSMTLSVEDVSCTEVWIRIKTNNISFPFYGLIKSDLLSINIKLITSETILYINSLSSSHQYNFQLNYGIIQSNKISVNTMDTTSHNITWQKFEFGGAIGSWLSDVAIIDENNIWAVGAVYLYDSLGNIDPNVYNAIHWDGNNWTVKRISTLNRGQYDATVLNAIVAFSSKDIWVSDGCPIHGDGTNWTLYQLWNMGVLGPNDGSSMCIWGTSSSDIYFAGNRGTMVHYNGINWEKLSSGTNSRIMGIYGSYDDKNNKEQILAVTNGAENQEIFSIDGNNVKNIPIYPIPPFYDFYSIWFSPNHHYYLAGSGIYEKNSLSDGVWRNGPLDITRKEITKIKANGLNDVFAVGAFGEVLHYNGVSWKSYLNESTGIDGSYTSLALKNNLIVIVGEDQNKAIIQIGRR